MTPARPALGDQRGFTLIELVISSTIGIVVLLAVFALMDVSVVQAGRTQDRVEVAQRGRNSMEQITQQLRSQICFGADQPLIEGTNTSVRFYADVGDEQYRPDMRVLTFVPNGRQGRITESVYVGQADANGGFTFPNWRSDGTGVPDRSRTVATGVEQVDAATPVFSYFGFRYDQSNAKAAATDTDILLNTPIASTDSTRRVVKIRVAYKVDAERTANSSIDALNQGDVFVRSADPLQPGKSPLCT